MLNSWSLGTIGVCALVAGAVYLWQARSALARALKGQEPGPDLAIALGGGVLLVVGCLALCNPITGLGPQHLGMALCGFGGLMLLHLVRQVAFDVVLNRALVWRRDRRILDRWASIAAGSAGLLAAGGVISAVTGCVQTLAHLN